MILTPPKENFPDSDDRDWLDYSLPPENYTNTMDECFITIKKAKSKNIHKHIHYTPTRSGCQIKK